MIPDHELDIITHMRGAIMDQEEHTGVNLFLVWGYPTAIVFLVEFAVLMLWHQNWCPWLWAAIPIVGAPLMIYYQQKDYDRTGRRTLDQNIVLQLWLFVGGASCLGGFTTGFAGVYEQCYCTFQGILVGMGCFLTGVISRFRPMTICGIIGGFLAFVCLFFQGELWPWQLLIMVLITFLTLILPGHLMLKEANKDPHPAPPLGGDPHFVRKANANEWGVKNELS